MTSEEINNPCSICLDEMIISDPSTYSIESCNHKFHTKCILEMYIKGFTDNCPICRTFITTSNTKTLKDCEDFRLSLIKKHAKKNKILDALFKRYDKYDNQIKDTNKSILQLKKECNSRNYKSIYKEYYKVKRSLRNVKTFLKRNKLCIKTKQFRFSRNSKIKFKTEYKFVNSILNETRDKIKEVITENIKEVEGQLKVIVENPDLVQVNIKKDKMKKLERKERILKNKQENIKTVILRTNV